jgi:glutamine synthetase
LDTLREDCTNKAFSVLTECWNHDGTPNKYNYRHECAKLMQSHAETVPWFGLEQEYTLLDLNDRPFGWPQNVCACHSSLF